MDQATNARTGQRDVTVLVMSFLIYGVLWLASSFYVVRRFRRGRGWARWTLITLWCLTGLGTTVQVLGGLVMHESGPGSGTSTVWLVMLVGGAVALAVGGAATWISANAEARSYFAERWAAQLAGRPDPGPAPNGIRYASASWCVAGTLSPVTPRDTYSSRAESLHSVRSSPPR